VDFVPVLDAFERWTVRDGPSLEFHESCRFSHETKKLKISEWKESRGLVAGGHVFLKGRLDGFVPF
jgi:hypothetical protein